MKRWMMLVLATLGCDDPLKEPQRIESTRVLGARVEAASDPARAWPEPNESATVSWLVADPRPLPLLGWAFSFCVGAPTERGVPVCEAPPFLELTSPGIAPGLPSISFTMPDSIALAQTDRVLLRGAICSDAPALLAEPLDASRCDGPGELELVLLEIGISSAEASNRNPTLSDELLSYDTVAWPPPSATLLGQDTCSSADAAPELPLVSANEASHQIGLTLSADDRESAETLFVSHASTAGRFDRPISVIDPDQSELLLELAWEAPGAGAETGRIARLYFVVRDLRGGVDWTVRTLCVVP